MRPSHGTAAVPFGALVLLVAACSSDPSRAEQCAALNLTPELAWEESEEADAAFARAAELRCNEVDWDVPSDG